MGELVISNIVLSVDNTKLGLQLKKARVEKGLSQDKVAAQLGVTWEMISRYENGRTSAVKHLERLAEIYNKPINYFLDTGIAQESFSIDQLVDKLAERGLSYQRNVRNVIKHIDKLSGRGLDSDLGQCEKYMEVPTTLTSNYDEVFALPAKSLELPAELGINNEETLFFARGVSPEKNEIVLGYDGISYKMFRYTGKELDVPLAVLISSERRYR